MGGGGGGGGACVSVQEILQDYNHFYKAMPISGTSFYMHLCPVCINCSLVCN